MTVQAAESADLELISFRVGEHEYSVDIMSVREIRGWSRATPLPHAPAHVRGVINLRGAVLPIVDLGCRLGLGPTETTARTVVLVVHLNGQAVGLLVDAVSDIVSVAEAELSPPPDMLSEGGPNFVRALAVVDGRMLRVLDLAAVHPGREEPAA